MHNPKPDQTKSGVPTAWFGSFLEASKGRSMDEIDQKKLLADQIGGLRGSVESIADDSMKELCATFLDDAVNQLTDLKRQHPRIEAQVIQLALSFASLTTCLTAHYAQKVKEHEESSRRGAEITNAKHELAVGVAQTFAQQEWEKPNGRSIRISEMSEKVWSYMVDTGYQSFLPDKSSGLADWIRPVAPDSAKKPGRPRKSP